MAIPYEPAVKEDLNLGHGTVNVTMPGGGTAVGNKIGIHTLIDRWFNIKDFGAVADGETDDLAAIHAAIAAANAAGGGVVVVPGGRYGISGDIVMSGSGTETINLIGAGSGASYLIPLANNIKVINHAGNSLVQGFGIDGTGRTGIVGVDMNTNGRVRDLYITDCEVGLDYVGVGGGAGVFYSVAEDLYIDTCAYGIRMQTTPSGGATRINSNSVINAVILNSTAVGVLIDGASGNVFMGLDIELNTQGVRILEGQGNRLYGRWFEKNPAAGSDYHLHIAYTAVTSGTVIHAFGLESWCGLVATTGDITSGTPTLTVASTTNILRGKVLRVIGAGAAGADLISEVIDVSGLDVTLADDAGTTVVGAAVAGPRFVTNASYQIMTEQFQYNFGTSFSQRLSFTTTPIITGSRGGNAALASLLSELASKGMLTDSTTA